MSFLQNTGMIQKRGENELNGQLRDYNIFCGAVRNFLFFDNPPTAAKAEKTPTDY
jgi:hypothetical protein